MPGAGRTDDRPAPPLIVTLGFDAASFATFDALRRRHFPPARNHLPAHLTLFHHLDGEEEAAIAATLREASLARPPLPLAVAGLRFLGYGSAFAIEAPALVALRQDLAARWRTMLTPQDASPFRPHVTIQNKAPAGEAKALFACLQAEFTPFDATGTELLLWRYRGGPWEAAGAFPFAGRPLA
ncbi:hypothetical protein GCM10011390_00610 [Aureimonas endophytica]|uniref:2'-5' RNA ligase n=1 Tax=Aureimonas endophytica TaxID=2027858 RepID=A0A916ZCL3_9HYPH|nr:2'-5' RNA ligase family protein [Aureimonas endophytica]GGD85933.1 hypothetical protein GCM10011390_00610 [Aureimonas endophytica]